MKRYLVLVTFVFMLGIVVGDVLRLTVAIWLVLTGLAFLLCTIFLVANREYVSLTLLTSVFLLGAFWYSLSILPADRYQHLAGREIQGQGYIQSYPRQGTYNRTFIVSLEKLSADGRAIEGLDKLLLNVTLGQGKSEFWPGDEVQFSGRLTIPNQATNPGQFDYRRYLANQQVFYEVRCSQGDCLVTNTGQGLRTIAAHGRARVAKLLSEILPSEERALIMGLLFGDISEMDSREMAAYQRAGVSHLFAVSGFNVAFVLGILWFVLALFRPSPLVRLGLALPLLLGYYFLVGWSPSIVRASLMAFLALTALSLGRKKDIYTALAGAALVILLISPGELFQVGFQLSFLTTLGLAYLTPWLQDRGLGKYLAPAVAAQLSSLPLIAYYFNLISLVAPFLNVIAALVSGLVTVLGLIGTLLTWSIPLLAKPVFLTCGLLMYALSRFIIWCSGFNWAVVVVPSPSLLIITLSYFFLAGLPYYRRYRYRILLIPRSLKIVVVGALGLTLLISCLARPDLLQVTFLDVGQGDSILIQTPGGQRILIDGGGTPESSFAVGERVVLPYLRKQGIGKLDAIIMSHNHLDHSEGLLEILPLLNITSFYMPPAEPVNQVDSMIRSLCMENDIRLVELTAGQKIRLEDEIEMEVLHPVAGDGTIGNNHSLVLRLVYGDSEWLLTGDIEKEVQERLLKGAPEFQADILKLPHHGSISSYLEEFYQEVSPQAVIASAGSNLFNHPHPQVVKYFTARGIPVYMTKINGAIITKSDGKSIKIYPFK